VSNQMHHMMIPRVNRHFRVKLLKSQKDYIKTIAKAKVYSPSFLPCTIKSEFAAFQEK
jgi:hypothetical protein